MTRKFAHRALLDFWRGKCRIQCACGKQSKVFTDPTEIVNWYDKHTGLIEVNPQKRSAS